MSTKTVKPASHSHVQPSEQAELWQRMTDSFSWEIPNNARVKAQRDWYLKHPKYLQTISNRAEPYLHLIVERLEAEGLPLELALLPVVESSFDPFAYSHGQAAGLWQFIPDTARRFGLEQNWWYDGRRDVVASTDTAIEFFKYLNRRFDGDWLHVLASYNAGEGRVRSAIRANRQQGKPTDYWSLSLPKETQAYVPKLLALADLIQNSNRYGLRTGSIPNKQVVRTVGLQHQIDLALAADMAGIELATLQRYNPGYNRWATAPDSKRQQLLLPLAAADRFESALGKMNASELMKWQRYKVKSGDSLSTIARRYGTTTALIKQANQLSSSNIRAGSHLMIPVSAKSLDDYPLTAQQRVAAVQSRNRGRAKVDYQVKSGDSLWKIGKTYGVSTRELARWNGFAPNDPIRPGQKMVIWLDKASTQQAKDAVIRKVFYTVRRGDSLWVIADRFGVSVKDVKRWNQLNQNAYLQPGQKLSLYVDVTRAS